MIYALTRQAEEDLIHIYLYGSELFGSLQAEKYYTSLENAFERIAKNPEMYPIAFEIRLGYRYCVHSAHTIFFTVEQEVKIIRIIGKQRFP
jgi:toxin ParE1/3/4